MGITEKTNLYCVVYSKYAQPIENNTINTYSKFIMKSESYTRICESSP